MSPETERNIIANESLPRMICANEECADYGIVYITADFGDCCPTCRKEGKEWD